MIYFYIYNLSCIISNALYVDNTSQKLDKMKICTENQKNLNEKVKEIFKKIKNGDEFKRKPITTKTMPL